MRIVGGMWRGRVLRAPEGKGTRPTTDRTRESLASMVLSAFDLDLSEVRILDAFAGSGAVGLELLSRGALSCTFVERDRRALNIVRDNVRAVGATPAQAKVMQGDVLSLAARGSMEGGPFGLVVLDPPYALDAAVVSQLVVDLKEQALLAPGARILYEHATDASELSLPDATLIKRKKRGTTTVTLLELPSSTGPEFGGRP